MLLASEEIVSNRKKSSQNWLTVLFESFWQLKLFFLIIKKKELPDYFFFSHICLKNTLYTSIFTSFMSCKVTNRLLSAHYLLR